jgi:hypothetical protein
MLTFVASPKSPTGPFATLERNALMSWRRLDPAGEILLFGDDPGVAGLAREVGARHIPEVATTGSGIPLLSDILARARDLASHELLAYVNADIVLTGRLLAAVRRVAAWRRRFLITGRRTRLELGPLDFEGPWEEELHELALRQGERQPGTDYFVFPRDLWGEVPPFAIGREFWSCWLLAAARRRRAVVVDASEVVLAVHPPHPYGSEPWRQPEWRRNEELLGGLSNAYLTPEATHLLLEREIRTRCRSCHPVCVCQFEEA